MLEELSIRDLAVVDRLSLSVDPGLTVLTGETGAGKSILLTALGLALGDRADSGSIRPGADRAEVVLNFSLEDAPSAREWLLEQSLEDEGACLLRRVITADGRSRAFINGTPVTIQTLQSLSQHLLEIHGQHAHVLLLKGSEQRRLLDEAAGNGPLLNRLSRCVDSWRQLSQDLSELEVRASQRAHRLEFLDFEIAEFEKHGVGVIDYGALVDEHGRCANAEKILEVGQSELARLYDGESDAVASRLSQAIRNLRELTGWLPALEGSVLLLEEAHLEVKEACQTIRREMDRQEADPMRLGELESRLATFHRLSRKHQIRPEELVSHLAAMKTEQEHLLSEIASPEHLRRQMDERVQEYRDLAAELTARRKTEAQSMQTRVSEMVRELGMPSAEVVWAVEDGSSGEPRSAGEDQIEILVRTNPGMPLRPLAKVASGGELSRISLAVQVALTGLKTVPTLIFDEVDSGVGGGTAEVVGRKLRELGCSRQVFAVTHLPQVAAQGHQHFKVVKTSEGDSTRTEVLELDEEARILEIARMLGGQLLTPQAIAHAGEMRQLAESGNACRRFSSE